ncbi:MAG: hypothetical protein J0L84_18285 [Verrucomicrobia bacterium]|nr:hypothetical protein [Verrucomicrobiota bacterium]
MIPRAFQATLHCRGIRVEVPEESPVVGFYAVRRTLAFSESQARRRLVGKLRVESKFRTLLGSAAGECEVEVEDLVEITLLHWLIRSQRTGFALYQKDGSDTAPEPGEASNVMPQDTQ